MISLVLVTSHFRGRVFTPYLAERSVANFSRRSIRRARRTRLAPWRARAVASWTPRPELAPVTTATWLVRLNMWILLITRFIIAWFFGFLYIIFLVVLYGLIGFLI